MVRQSQAHAWCEVWIDGRGWVRIDPTAAVAPGRVGGDVEDVILEREFIGLMSYFRGTPLEPWAEPVAGILDLMNSRWNKWVMGYSVFEQESLFSRIGIDLERGAGPVKAFITALVVLAAIALFAGFFLLYRKKTPKDQLALTWQQFCLKMDRIGLPRQPAQGPVDYMHYIVQRRPDLESKIREIVTLYTKQRYGALMSEDETGVLQGMVKQFHPQRSKI